MSPPSRSRRDRLIACDACHIRKLKCSRPLPEGSALGAHAVRCSGCERRHLACVYPEKRRRGGPKTGKRLQAIRASQQSLLPPQPESYSAAGNELAGVDADGSWDAFGPVVGTVASSDGDTAPVHPDPNKPSCDSYDAARLPQGSRPDCPDQPPPDTSWVGRDAPGECGSTQAAPGLQFSEQDMIDQLAPFFQDSFQSYPIIHLDSMLWKIRQGVFLCDTEFRTLVLSLALMNETRKFRGSPELGSTRLDLLSRTIEGLRTGLDYHFSEPNSLDTVIVSLFLFVAYVARGRHTRAFVYLTEAIGLLDLVDLPPDAVEAARYRRLEHVLYIAESATASVFGWKRRKLARRPQTPRDGSHALALRHDGYAGGPDEQEWPPGLDPGDVALRDARALELLLAMTRVYTASNVIEVPNLAVGNLVVPTDTQTADLAITRLWKLASHWREAVVTAPGSFPVLDGNLDFTLRELGATAVCWSRAIPPSQLRNVGLRKIVALADELIHIATTTGHLAGHIDMIGALMQLVAERDYDGRFVSELSAFDSCVRSVPAALACESLRSQNEPAVVEVEADGDDDDEANPPSSLYNPTYWPAEPTGVEPIRGLQSGAGSGCPPLDVSEAAEVFAL